MRSAGLPTISAGSVVATEPSSSDIAHVAAWSIPDDATGEQLETSIYS